MSAAGSAASPSPRARLLTLLAALALAALFAWNVSRTWFQGDDAFISFRYARHLADGLGPVWNAGERVEGYTNFAWVVLMAAGMRLGLEPELFSNVLGVASGALLLLSLFRFAARKHTSRSLWPWLLILVLATSRSFAAWCTGGLETMFFALLVFLGFACLLQREPAREREALLSALCFAAAALTRPEGVLFAALAGVLLLVEVLQRRHAPRALLTYAAPLVLVIGAHLLWRHAYYGAWLPNTFTAKVGGLWLEQGWRYLTYFHDLYRIGFFLPLVVLACLGPRRRTALALLFVLLGYGAYVVAVGGDLFELRFCVHVFALFYWLLIEGLAVLAAWALPGRLLAAAAALALLVTTQLGFERVPGGRYGLRSVVGITEYTKKRQEEGRTLRAFIEQGVLPRELVLGLGGAGAVPYYTGWETVDRRGLNDATIARLPLAQHGFVGHEHDAPYEYLVERRVVVFDYFNQLLLKRASLRQLKGPYTHDGHALEMRALVLPGDERVLVFATFVSDAELARLFPGVELLRLGGR